MSEDNVKYSVDMPEQINLAPVDPEQELELLLQAEIESSLANIDPKPPRIKVSRENTVFMLPDGTTAKSLTGIIVFHHKARGYWEIEGQKIPSCSSMDGQTGIDDNGSEHACQKCRQNRYGSGKDGRGKACKEMRWVYLLQEDETIPSRISFSPTSIGSFDNFITAIVQKRLAPIQKIVKLSLETGESNGYKYSVLAQPEVVGDTPRESIITLVRMRESVVAAARKAGIEAEDYYVEDKEQGPGGEQPY